MTPVKLSDFTGDRNFTGEVHRDNSGKYLLLDRQSHDDLLARRAAAVAIPAALPAVPAVPPVLAAVLGDALAALGTFL